MLKHSSVAKFVLWSKQIQNSNHGIFKNTRWITTIATHKDQYFDDRILNAAKPFEEIPHLRILPWIGNAWIYMPIIGLFDINKPHLAALEKRKMLGDIFRERFGKQDMVITHNADDIQMIFKNEGPYPSRGELHSLKKYRESRKQWYKTTGFLALQGKQWYELRSKTQKHLLKPKAVQAYLNPMQDVARDFIDKIYICRDSSKEMPDFLKELYKWALESVALVGLDTRLGCLEKELSPDSDALKIIKCVQTQFDLLFKLEPFSGNLQFWRIFPTPMWKKFVSASDVFTQLAFKYINFSLERLKTRSEDEENELTLLQSMLMTKDVDVSDAIVTVTDMLLAGIDTTSHTVGFFLQHIARNPDKQELLYQEIKRLLPHKEDRITQNVFNDLKYLKACIKESQRLDPIVGGSARTLDHDVVLSGYRIPAGTMLIGALQNMSRDERYFPKPNQFLPERWLKKDENFHPFAFLPFGIGTRSCIGRRLAELEVICLITELIRNFRIEYHYEDIGMVIRLVNTPDKPLKYTFIER